MVYLNIYLGGVSMIVPEKTIAYYSVAGGNGKSFFVKDVEKFLRPLNRDHTREWFTAHFYKCLPLSVANMQGYVFSVPFEFEVVWDGTSDTDGLKINYERKQDDDYLVDIRSEFGYGIFTIHFPIILKTPPGINLMTIAPPNYPTPGISPLSGFVEADNLQFTFTLNFKVDFVNLPVKIPANQPIMGMLPIPRYFCDSFELKNAYDIFDEEEIKKEKEIYKEYSDIRERQNHSSHYKNEYDSDAFYFRGTNPRGDKFLDHQLPRKKK